jgi:hypothetical protein
MLTQDGEALRASPRLTVASSGRAYALERAADPLDRARIDTKSLSYLAHALSTSRGLESG